jgi:hypothetical protein
MCCRRYCKWNKGSSMHLGCPRFYKLLVSKRESARRTICVVLRWHVGNILSKDDGKATKMVCQDQQRNKRMEVRITNAFKCQSMWQWKNQGPGLSVKNRIVTLSPVSPMVTTSRKTGSSKLYEELPALRTTANE